MPPLNQCYQAIQKELMIDIHGKSNTSNYRMEFFKIMSSNNWNNQPFQDLTAFAMDSLELAMFKGLNGQIESTIRDIAVDSSDMEVAVFITKEAGALQVNNNVLNAAMMNNNVRMLRMNEIQNMKRQQMANMQVNNNMYQPQPSMGMNPGFQQRQPANNGMGYAQLNNMGVQQHNMQNNMHPSMQNNMQNNMHPSMQNNMQHTNVFNNSRQSLHNNIPVNGTANMINGGLSASTGTFATSSSLHTAATQSVQRMPIPPQTPVVYVYEEEVPTSPDLLPIATTKRKLTMSETITISGVEYPLSILSNRNEVSPTEKVAIAQHGSDKVFAITVYHNSVLECYMDASIVNASKKARDDNKRIFITDIFMAKPYLVTEDLASTLAQTSGDSLDDLINRLKMTKDINSPSMKSIETWLTKEVNLGLNNILNIDIAIDNVFEDYRDLFGHIKVKEPNKLMAFRELDSLLSQLMVTIPELEESYKDLSGLAITPDVGFVVSKMGLCVIEYSNTIVLDTSGSAMVHFDKTPWLYDICKTMAEGNYLNYVYLGGDLYRVFASLVAKDSYSILKM